MVNWDAIAAIGEILGATAVVVSLLYVAREVRSNTKAMKASAGFDSAGKMADLNLGLAASIMGDAQYQQGGESRFTRLVAQAYDPNARPEDMELSDHLVLGFINRALFQRIEGEYYLFQHGFLDPEQWNGRRSWACGYLDLPLQKAWWEVEKTQGVLRPEFIAALKVAEFVNVQSPGRPGYAPADPAANQE